MKGPFRPAPPCCAGLPVLYQPVNLRCNLRPSVPGMSLHDPSRFDRDNRMSPDCTTRPKMPERPR
ncbi:hypothetical protein X946_5557 [Burkholderia sp. ABCPW 111]|nr:hypothetical protein X946_5557 [Burkholderia sp. ABCPW 111]